MTIISTLDYIPQGFHTDGTSTWAHLYLGRTAERERVMVDVKLENLRPEHLPTTYDTHEAVLSAVRLSITGVIYMPHASTGCGFGQVINDIRRITSPAGRLRMRDIRTFVNIWDVWHLNDMIAGCAHQVPVYEPSPWGSGQRVSLDGTPACPLTGYRYERSWLVRPMQRVVLDELSRLALLAPAQGSRYADQSSCRLSHQ